MHPKDIVKEPQINDLYFDPDEVKLYQYVKLGDFPAEWVDTTPNEHE